MKQQIPRGQWPARTKPEGGNAGSIKGLGTVSWIPLVNKAG